MASNKSQQYQALRSSCERCRFYKLKCSGASGWRVNDNNQDKVPLRPCDRCLRAKVDCVFGRRAQISCRQNRVGDKSRTKSSTSTSSTTSISSDLNVNHEETTSTPSSNLLSWSSEDTRDNSPNCELTQDANHMLLTEPDFLMSVSTEDFSLDNVQAWDHFDGDERDVMNISTQCDLGQSVQNVPVSNQLDLHGNVKAQEFKIQDAQTQTHMLDLSTLVADIMRTSHELCNGLWKASAQAGTRNIDLFPHYPIGSVLNLVRKFRAILSDISRENSQSKGPGLSVPGSIDSVISSTMSGPQISFNNISSYPNTDNATRVLALSCHISLVKLYGIVFQDLENVLAVLPGSSIQCTFSPPASYNNSDDNSLSNLRLHELPSIDETCSKVHTAVSMLLQAFPTTEMALDSLHDSHISAHQQAPVANMIRHNPLLGSSSTAVQDEFDRTFGKLQSLKRLLLRKLEH